MFELLTIARAKLRNLVLHTLVFGPFRGLWYGLTSGTRVKVVPVTTLIGSTPRSVFVRPNTSDVEVFKKVFWDKEYSPPFPGTPQTILDLGANIGLSTLYFKILYPNAQILAVEPDPCNFAILQRNVASLAQVSTIQAAAWPNDDVLDLINPGSGAWGMRVSHSKRCPIESETVRGCSMTALFSHFASPTIDLIKIDIEGSEYGLFKSCDQWISKVNAIVIELHDRFQPGCSRAFFAAASGLPHEHWAGENLFVWNDQMAVASSV